MSKDATKAVTADARGLASSLAPLVIEACDNKLSDIIWFKADWQRGGAATAKAVFSLPDGIDHPVVIKLPVVQRELLWTKRLQEDSSQGSPVPRLFASGETLGGYDLAWIVIEQFPFGPLGLHWNDSHIPRIAEAAASFYARASEFEVDQDPKREDWDMLLKGASESVKINQLSHSQRWKKALKEFRSRLDGIVTEWRARDTSQWLHGDLHLANAMSRSGLDDGPVSLIDLAEVHAGHWVEDAVFLERQLWAKPERIKPHPPVKTLARERKKLGLSVEDDYSRLATIRRALLASTAPKFIRSEGHPVYLEKCLERLESSLQELK